VSLNGAETLLSTHGSTKNHVSDARKVPNDSNQPRNCSLNAIFQQPARKDNPELTMTKVATKKSKPPASRAADFSADAESGLERNRQRTMIAENSSMALSPPNPRRADFSPSKQQQAPRRLLGSSRQLLASADGQHDAVNLEPDVPLR
jgi:hypothetical protein